MTQTLARLVALVAPGTRWRWLLLLPIALVNAGLEFLLAALIAVIIATLGGEPNLALSMRNLVPGLGDDPEFRQLAILAVGVVLIKNALKLVEVFWRDRCVTETIVTLSGNLFRRFLSGRYEDWLRVDSSERMRTLHERVAQVCWEGLLSIPILVYEAFVVIGIFLFTLTAAPLGAILLGGGIVFVLVPIFWIVNRAQKRFGERLRETGDAVWAITQASFRGLKEIKVFGRESFFTSRYIETRARMGTTARASSFFSSWPEIVVEVLFVVAFVSIGAWFLGASGAGSTSVSTFIVLGYAGFRALQPIYRILFRWSALGNVKAAVDDVWTELEKEVEPENRSKGEREKSAMAFNRELAIAGVSYRYPGERECLAGIDVQILPGEFVAIVGRTGSGKTTVLHLLAGLLRPASGVILADGTSIFDALPDWRKTLGFVPQTSTLIPGTLLENIAFGIGREEADGERVSELLARVGLEEWSDRLEMRIGERARELSGGQRQQVAMARALYGNPRMLLLDEATSALDPETERIVMDGVLGDPSMTRVMVTHRLSNTRRCDKIILLDEGELAGVGTYADLTRENEVFRRLLAEREKWLL